MCSDDVSVVLHTSVVGPLDERDLACARSAPASPLVRPPGGGREQLVAGGPTPALNRPAGPPAIDGARSPTASDPAVRYAGPTIDREGVTGDSPEGGRGWPVAPR